MAFDRRVRTEFDANTAQFERGVRRMNDQMRRFQRGTESRLDRIDNRFRRSVRAVRQLRNAFAALAAVAGLRQLTRNVEQAVNQLDNIAKAADRLGLTTDALQELRVAAELSGVSVRTFDLAFQRFVRRAGEAANGTGEAQDALETLGITMQELQTLSPEALFLRVAEAMGQTDDAAERLRLGFKLFDSEGVQVVEMLRNGTDGLEEMRAKARELGLVFESDLIRRTVEMRDELTLIQRQLNVDVTEAMVNLGPVIRDLGGLLVWLAERAAQAREGFVRLFSGQLAQSIADLGIREELDAARAELAGLNAELERALNPATRSPEMQVRLNFAQNRASIEGRPFDEANFILEQFAERRTELVDRVDNLQTRLGQILAGEGGEDLVPSEPSIAPPAPSRGGGAAGGGTARTTPEQRESFLERELRLLAERTAVLRTVAEAQRGLNPELENYETALRAAEVEALLIARAEAENVEITDELARKIREVAQAYAEAEGAADGLRQRQEEIDDDDALKGLADRLGAAIAQAQSFEGALEAVLRKLAEVALQAALLSAFTGGQTPEGKGNALSGFFDDLFSGLFHKGGVVGKTPVPMRQVPAAAFLGAPRLHSGGIAGLRSNEVPAILERGEIVVPKNIGGARVHRSVTVEGSTVILQGSEASPEELRRVLDERDQRVIAKLIRLNEDDPSVLHT